MESSNRIEGAIAPLSRIEALAREQTQPRNRSEQQIAGYRNVLNSIHVSAHALPLKPSVILQLHRNLCRFLPQSGGEWKRSDYTIAEEHPDGTRRERFQPVEAWQTAEAMDQLCTRSSEMREAAVVESLLLDAAFTLNFLGIHPFKDRNGRMSRLLALLLLYQDGCEVGRYSSLEMLVEESKAGCYSSLETASTGWHLSQHSLDTWWPFFSESCSWVRTVNSSPGLAH